MRSGTKRYQISSTTEERSCKMNAKFWLYSVMALILTGCLSEQERLERARQEKIRQEEQEKESAQKREKQRVAHLEEYWKDVAAYNVMLLEKHVLNGYGFFDEGKGKEILSLLHEWVKGQRKDVWSGKKLLKGESELEAFGLKYMPNAYSYYEKVRDAALECQQVFEENFSKFEDPKGEKWTTFKSALTAFSNARTQSLRRKDELAHYYLLYKVGAITQNELLEIDQKPIVLWLLEKEPSRQDIKSYRFDLSSYAPLDEKTKAFVVKFMVETSPVLERLESRCKATEQLFGDVCAAMKMFGYVRYDLSKIACWEENKCVVRELAKANEKIKDWHLKYQMMALNSTELNKKDEELAKQLKEFENAIQDYVKIRARGPLFPPRRLLDGWYDGKYVMAWQFRALGFYVSQLPDANPDDVNANAFSSYSAIIVGGDYYDQKGIGRALDRSIFATLLSKELGIYAHDPVTVERELGSKTRCNNLHVTVVARLSKDECQEVKLGASEFEGKKHLTSCGSCLGLVCPLNVRMVDTYKNWHLGYWGDWSVPILTLRALDVDNKIYGFKCVYKGADGYREHYKVEVCQ